jgi:hypothetical protein
MAGRCYLDVQSEMRPLCEQLGEGPDFIKTPNSNLHLIHFFGTGFGFG